MTERLTVLSDSADSGGTHHDGQDVPGGPLLERLERAAMLTIARMGDNSLVVPLASAGLKLEIATRHLLEGATTRLWHASQLPTRREVLMLSEQLAALRHRVTQLERSQTANSQD